MTAQPTGPRGLVVLGSTGSIGDSTLDVVRSLGPERLRVTGLAAGRRVEKLAEQARELRPKFVSCLPGEPHEHLQSLLKGEDIAVLAGADGARAMVADDSCEVVLAAITGAAGLPAVLEAARRGRRLCLSNKESLVAAGPIVQALSRDRSW